MLRLFSLEKLRESLVIGFKYLTGGCKEDELRLNSGGVQRQD